MGTTSVMYGAARGVWRKLSPEQQERIWSVRTSAKRIAGRWAGLVSGNLTLLAQLFETDKWGKHDYTPRYQQHFAGLRFKRVNVLEIGVGGYGEPKQGGASLRMWKSYFRRGRIHAIDIHDKSALEERRIRIYRGSQDDARFLTRVLEQSGDFDIIIDDGSHINAHVIASFEILFPHVKPGGWYVIEDVQTAYSPRYGGADPGATEPPTSIAMVKRLIDGLNHRFFYIPNYSPTFTDSSIAEIHCYKNIIFIKRASK